MKYLFLSIIFCIIPTLINYIVPTPFILKKLATPMPLDISKLNNGYVKVNFRGLPCGQPDPKDMIVWLNIEIGPSHTKALWRCDYTKNGFKIIVKYGTTP